MADEFSVAINYTTNQAIKDGVLIPIGKCGEIPVLITRNCFEQAGLDDAKLRETIVRDAIAALKEPDPEDDGYRKIRTLSKWFGPGFECLWAVLDGQGMTLMCPEDY